jgi:tetratricopeptide (TPR) repeat protein
MTHPGAPPLSRPPTARSLSIADWACATGLLLVTATVFSRAWQFDYIFIDDGDYVSNNPIVAHGLSWAGVRWGWTHTVVANWHPLTVWAEMAVTSLLGYSAASFHIANVFVHAADVALLFLFLRRATGRAGPAVAAALLWGLHPLRVESVAWVSELKDVLAGCMWLCCLLAYVGYVRRRTPARYALVALLAALALLAKATAITLPFALLLLDYWPLNGDFPADRRARVRWWSHRVVEKLPLLAMSLAVTVVGIRSQLAPGRLLAIPTAARLANAVTSAVAYLRDLLLPTDLGFYYPHPWLIHRPIAPAAVVASTATLVALTAVAITARRRRPYLAVGWLWFLGLLVPVSGLLQSGDQARADRFTFLPAMGITVAVVWCVADWSAASSSRRSIAAIATAVAAVALTAVTVPLTDSWRTSETLFGRALAVMPDNYTAEVVLATLDVERGDYAGAEPLARRAIALAPESTALAYAVLAEVEDHRDQPDLATADYNQAIRRDPTNASLRLYAARFLIRRHNEAAAVRQLDRAVAVRPTDTASWVLLGTLHAGAGDNAAAAVAYRRALALSPGTADVEGKLADALHQGGDGGGAVEHYAAAIRDGASNPSWEAQLAWLTAGDDRSSADRLRSVLPIARDACDRTENLVPFPLHAYSLVLAKLGRFDDAIVAATTARDRAAATGQTAETAVLDRWIAAYRQRRASLDPVSSRPASTVP